jgi:hypothetical protein
MHGAVRMATFENDGGAMGSGSRCRDSFARTELWRGRVEQT